VVFQAIPKGNIYKNFLKNVLKGVHFKILFWYVLAYLKGIQDVGVFVYTIV